MSQEGASDVEALMLAWGHVQARRFDLAEAAARDILAKAAGNADAMALLGAVAHQNGRLGEALGWMERVAAQRPNAVGALAALCDLYRQTGAPAKAIEAGRRACAVDPRSVAAVNNLGLVLLETDDVRGGLECLDRLVELEPNNAQFHLRRSMIRMLTGDVDGGLAEYEWRLAIPNVRPPDLPQLRPPVLPGQPWRGESLMGKRIFVWNEQGLGDAIHCIRFVAALAAQGALLIAGQLPPKLHPLVRLNFPYVQIVPHGAPIPEADYHCELMSLMRLVGRSKGWAEKGKPYFEAPADLLDGFRRRFAPHGGIKVGLVWAGNSNHKDDAKRSMPGPALLPLLRIVGCDFFSLQVGAKPQDGVLFDAGLIDLSPEVSNIPATAAAIAALDLVIGVDTSLVHLAGALGVPVWTTLCSVPDWRWGLEGAQTSLYRSMRLFRQRRSGDWPQVIEDVGVALAAAVKAKMGGSGHPAGLSKVS